MERKGERCLRLRRWTRRAAHLIAEFSEMPRDLPTIAGIKALSPRPDSVRSACDWGRPVLSLEFACGCSSRNGPAVQRPVRLFHIASQPSGSGALQ